MTEETLSDWICEYEWTGKFIKVNRIKDFIKKLKEHISINGNLSYRIVENEDGTFEHKHDRVLNNIVIELIEDLAGKKLI